jgi:hypothetical protein
MQAADFICKLETRCLIKISGKDAEEFLQGVVTNDILKLDAGRLVYACLLMPQGRFLHDLFIFKRESDFYIECDSARLDDFLKRIKIYKMRADVTIADLKNEFSVYVSSKKPEQDLAFSDPRNKILGYRFYLSCDRTVDELSPQTMYRDFCIAHGVPDETAMKPEADIVADINLDLLNAVSWDKGCYIGQEVTARVYYKSIAKKRLVHISGEGLTVGADLTQEGYTVGEIRAVNSNQTEGLAQLKLSALENLEIPVVSTGNKPLTIRLYTRDEGMRGAQGNG